jgi:uncharacterized membrane protein
VDGIPLVGNILASVMSWYGTATTVTQYTGIFGYAWIVGMALIGLELVRRRDEDADPATTRILVAVSVATGLAGLLLPMPLLLMAAVPLGLVVLLVLRDARVTPANVALTLFAVGFALTLIPEFFYLLDVFNNRMNTVFKLYYQAWTMFALGAAIGAVVLWDALRRFTFTRIALPALAALMIAGGVGATAVGVNQWLNWRPVAHNQGWIGMDGLHFLELDTGAEAAWAGEHAAITWLYEHARNGDVMLAAGGCEFTLDIGTTAAGSGVPTILGWEGHETQWHLGQEGFRQEIRQRVADINRMWETLDPDLLDQYGVTLLYVGPIEQRGPIYPNRETFTETCAPGPFASAADPAFPGAGWTQVYTNEEGVRIYRREGD